MARNFTKAMLADLLELRDSCNELAEFGRTSAKTLTDIAAELTRRATRQQYASQRVNYRLMREATTGTPSKKSDQ